MPEGWTWLLVDSDDGLTAHRTQQHYFTNTRVSICGGWILESGFSFLRPQPGDDVYERGYAAPCAKCLKLTR